MTTQTVQPSSIHDAIGTAISDAHQACSGSAPTLRPVPMRGIR
ncbi:MAG: hypothetical protein ACTS2F_00745 [Thainema sp.]